MTDQLEKLCKRLSKFTLDDILEITEFEDETVQFGLQYLEMNGKIKKLKHENYIYLSEEDIAPVKQHNKKLSLMSLYHSSETIDLIIRCFCLEIPIYKTSCLVTPQINCIDDFNILFKKHIYDRQKEELLELYLKKPQKGRYRIFFKDIKAYLYIYNNQVYVSDKELKSNKEINFTKEEISEFKKICCYLSRLESHNMNKQNLHYNLAEKLWRRGKDFEDLYNDIKNNIFCNLS